MILFLIPSMRGGGAEKVTLLLANQLVEKNWSVTLLMAAVEGPYLKQLNEKIKIIRLPHKRMSRNILSIKRNIENENPDIFYTSMNHVNIVGSIAHKLSTSNSRLILSEHNDVQQAINNSGYFIGQLLKYGMKLTYPFADKIVCVSFGVESGLKHLIPKLTSTTVIYNPIEQFKAQQSTAESTMPYRIISMGRLTKQKNFNLLIKAFEYLITNFKVDATLAILGEGEGRVELERIIKSKSLTTKVTTPGFQDPQTYFSNSDVFVLSSDWEGFGNVIVEALSAGLPIVSTNCPSGPSEILADGKYGKLVTTNNHIALAQAIYDTYSTPDELPKKKERIKRARDFSPEKIADSYINLFYSVLK